MKPRHIAFAGVVGAWMALAPGWVQSNDADTLSRKRIDPKEALVRRLLEDSPAVARIRASGNGVAIGYMDQATEHHAAALRALEAQDFARADAQLNDAMWLVGRARQLVPDPMARSIELRVRNAALRQSLQALRASYEAQLRQVVASAGEGGIVDTTLARVDARLEEAQGYSAAEQLAEANASLRVAEEEMLGGLLALIGKSTLRYGQQFASPADEYAYELVRYASYRDLVPVAREQLHPGPAAQAAMERQSAAAAARLKRAEAAASAQDYRAALATLRTATSHLESALAEAGLVVPRTGER